MGTLFGLPGRMDKLSGADILNGICAASPKHVGCVQCALSMPKPECGQAGLRTSQHCALNNGCLIRTAARLADQGAGPARPAAYSNGDWCIGWRLRLFKPLGNSPRNAS